MNDPTQDLVFILGEIRGQLTVVTELLKRSEERQTDLEIRVRALEHAHAKVIGGAVALSGLLTLCVDWFLK